MHTDASDARVKPNKPLYKTTVTTFIIVPIAPVTNYVTLFPIVQHTAALKQGKKPHDLNQKPRKFHLLAKTRVRQCPKPSPKSTRSTGH
jgi:hypothetical protein